jgi:lysophospholipase L1-like esterase
MSAHINSLLCLGDSYTIGESVALHAGFPYQSIQLLRKKGFPFHAPEIVAQTGWTSFELADHLLNQQLEPNYDFVTLLIGVNNQYRGLPIKGFENDFEFLLKKAIHFAGDNNKQVVVISIPDWSVTPFASKRSIGNASKEIDDFNLICQSLANKYQCQFINITAQTRLAKNDSSLLASDQLHYSAKSHSVWASELATAIEQQLSKQVSK